jgi:hypothetical protein
LLGSGRENPDVSFFFLKHAEWLALRKFAWPNRRIRGFLGEAFSNSRSVKITRILAGGSNAF